MDGAEIVRKATHDAGRLSREHERDTIAALEVVEEASERAQIIPARGTMYAVDVTIVAQSGTTVFNGFFFVAGDQDGATIAPAVGAVKPGITSGQLAAGQTVAGHIAFDVPEGRSITQVALRDPQGKTLAIWGSR
jgi:hypothetical protein